MHITTVIDWVDSDGSLDRKAMAEALNFFRGRYPASGNIYRGTTKLQFDGKPASYTKSLHIAEGFAVAQSESGWFSKKDYFVIRRTAHSDSIDINKLLREYATCKIDRCDEQEVICFNTPVGDRNITEYGV